MIVLIPDSSDQIAFSRAQLHCSWGLDFALVDNRYKLLLTWRDTNVITYCRANGPYPASGAQRLVFRLSNLDLRGAHPSFKVEAGGVYLPLADSADANLAGYNGFCGSCSTPFIEPQISKFSSQ